VKLVVVATVALVPAAALAQVPVNPGAPDAPTTLSPGQSGNQTPPGPPQPKQGPGVVIIGPDGKVLSGDSAPAAPGGVYIPSGGGDQPVDNPQDVYTGQVPELHVVRKGDTLWDICFLYFNDPWQWPKIWSYNPQITNPHWIYPGDLVRLLPRGMFAQATPAQAEPEGPVPPTPVDALPAPQRRSEVAIRQTAFVEKSDLDKSITIDGAVDEKVLLGNGDTVYLSYPSGRPDG